MFLGYLTVSQELNNCNKSTFYTLYSVSFIIYRNIDSESLPHFLNKSLTYFCKTGEKRDGTDVIYISQYNPRIKAVLAAIIGGCASERLGWVSGTVCLHRAAAVADQLCAVTITGPADLSCSRQSAVEWAHGRSLWNALRSVLLLPFGYFRSFVFVSLFFYFYYDNNKYWFVCLIRLLNKLV